MTAPRGAAAPARFRVAPITAARPTDVIVGRGALGRLDALLDEGRPAGARRLVAVDAGVAPVAVHGRWVGEWRPDPEATIVVPAGEAAKTRAVHARLEDAFLARGIGRDDVVIAVGGGAVLDVVGFAAATVGRGIPWVAVPTSVVGQVDAGLGGKTAVNHRLGKNMIGAFHQPVAVLVDTGCLATLPAREVTAGLAEVVKYGAIRDAAFFDWLERNMRALREREDDALAHAIHESCRVKAEIVAADERETGERALLNFGHTFGHAIETATGYGTWLHGEAVGTGMLLASRLSERVCGLPAAERLRVEALVAAAGLPTVAPTLAIDRWLDLMGRDKKVEHGRMRFVLLERLARAVVRADVEERDLAAVLSG